MHTEKEMYSRYNSLWVEGCRGPAEWHTWARETINVALYFGGPTLMGVDQRNVLLDLVLKTPLDVVPDSRGLLIEAAYYRGLDVSVKDLSEGFPDGPLWVSRIEKRKRWDIFWDRQFWPNFKRVCSGPLSYDDTGRLQEFLLDPWRRGGSVYCPAGPVAMDESLEVTLLYSGATWRVVPDRLKSVDDMYHRFTDFGTLVAWVGSPQIQKQE